MDSTNSIPGAFETKAAARLYDRGRGDGDDEVIALVEKRLSNHHAFHRAVDVGCGTGRSTRVLSRVASDVLGVDVSKSMLEVAATRAGPSYVRAAAEHLPFAGDCIDLLTTTQVVEFVDLNALAAEAARTLAPGGYWVAYGSRIDWGPLAEWIGDTFPRRFPERTKAPQLDPAALHPRLQYLAPDVLHESEELSLSQVVDLLMSTEQVLRAVGTDAARIGEATTWLHRECETQFTPPLCIQRQWTVRYFQKLECAALGS